MLHSRYVSEAAIHQYMFDNHANHPNVLGVVDVLSPGEREVFRDPLVDLVSELTRLGVLSEQARRAARERRGSRTRRPPRFEQGAPGFGREAPPDVDRVVAVPRRVGLHERGVHLLGHGTQTRVDVADRREVRTSVTVPVSDRDRVSLLAENEEGLRQTAARLRCVLVEEPLQLAVDGSDDTRVAADFHGQDAFVHEQFALETHAERLQFGLPIDKRGLGVKLQFVLRYGFVLDFVSPGAEDHHSSGIDELA